MTRYAHIHLSDGKFTLGGFQYKQYLTGTPKAEKALGQGHYCWHLCCCMVTEKLSPAVSVSTGRSRHTMDHDFPLCTMKQQHKRGLLPLYTLCCSPQLPQAL